MRTSNYTRNVWASTGGVTPLALDYLREHTSWNTSAGGHLDAPSYLPSGAFVGFDDKDSGHRITVPGVASRS